MPTDRHDDGVAAEGTPVGDPHRVRVDEAGRSGLLDQLDPLATHHLGQSPLLMRVLGDPVGIGQGGGDVHLGGITPQAELPQERASRTSRAARARVRTGAGPWFRLVPPTRLASTRVTSAPSSRACSAAVAPAGPPPSTSSRITAPLWGDGRLWTSPGPGELALTSRRKDRQADDLVPAEITRTG
jgi:hypothetical protein